MIRIKRCLTITTAMFIGGLFVSRSVFMPDYAAVYLDDMAKTYIALPCMDAWHRKPTKTFDLVRLGNAGDAWRQHYEPDYDCGETGAFFDDSESLSVTLLVWLGIVDPIKKHWWDMPYRTEDGVVWPQKIR